MKISYIAIAGVVVIIASIIIFPNFFKGIKGKIDNQINSQYSVELFEQKSMELRSTYVKVTQRIQILDSKIKSYTDKMTEITSNYTKEEIASNVKLKSKVDMYSKIITSLTTGKTKLEELRDKVKGTLENYNYNIEILKNKKVLKDSLQEVNSYLKEFNIDNTGIDPDNIINQLDESIIEEEATLKAYGELENMNI